MNETRQQKAEDDDATTRRDAPDREETSRERRASSLDLAESELEALASEMTRLVVDYFADISELPIFPQTSAPSLARKFRGPLPAEPDELARVVEDCRSIIEASRHNGSPRFFGYVASPAAPVGAFATLLASAINQNVTSWRSSPAATEIEKTVVGWLAEMVGYGSPSGGLLTSGGSMANLNALYVAHRATLAEGDPSRQGLAGSAAAASGERATLYISDQAHFSVVKAADVLGLGREQARTVETDERYRMDVRLLRERIAADIQQGFRPFCVVASAGTVATGAVDPLAEVAEVAAEHSLWFHVDGAYGALAALDPSRRSLFAGIERADSVSLDPHKWLYTPLDCGCLLLRDPARARAAFSGAAAEGDYVKVYEQDEDEAFAFWDYGVELSRPFRALKVWMMLRYYGARRFAQAIAEDNALAAYLSERIEREDDFELLAPTTLGICCFRYLPASHRGRLDAARRGGVAGREPDEGNGDLEELNREIDELNARIMHAVQRGGRAYLSNASLRGRFALRASITNFRTTRRDLDATLDAIRDAAVGAARHT